MVQILEFVTNRERKLINVLRPISAKCRHMDICVAFVKKSGVLLLKEVLNPKAKVQLVTGTDYSITEPDALKELLDNPRYEVRLHPSGEVFHPKFYILRGEGATKIVLGSSSLTGGAWSTNLESNFLCSLEEDEPLKRELDNYFDHLWNNSSTVTDDLLNHYRRIATRIQERERHVRSEPRIYRSFLELECTLISSRPSAAVPQYWLIIYLPPNADVCTRHRLISFNEDNPAAMERFQNMRTGDFAIGKDTGGNLRYVWRINSDIFDNPDPSEPWESEGTLKNLKVDYSDLHDFEKFRSSTDWRHQSVYPIISKIGVGGMEFSYSERMSLKSCIDLLLIDHGKCIKH